MTFSQTGAEPVTSANCPPSKSPAAFKQYRRDFLIATVLYTVVLFASVSVLQRMELPKWAVVLVALAPVAPVALMLRAYLTVLGKMDELQRRIQSEAILIAAGVVGFGSFAYGFLEGANVLPSIPGALLWILPAMIAVWGVALPYVSRRYS
jgi:hypothetical protein